MGVKGIRKSNDVNEPTLLGNINSILQKALRDGLFRNYSLDIEALVKNEGIIVKYSVLPSSVSGYLKEIDGNWTIVINEVHHPKRQRFTIAHEFAHYCLHRKNNDYFEDTTFFRKSNDATIEYKANEFAAELLMPENMFRTLIEGGTKKIVELANLFDVSTEAIKYRAKAIGYNIKGYE